jgi:maltooligosyltrehalose trehalohydrolase
MSDQTVAPEINQSLGAVPDERGCSFRVWAPDAESVDVRLVGTKDRWVPLSRDGRGYHHGYLEGIQPGQRYLYRLNGQTERPDPASRFQPEGVHGASQVVSPRFGWTDRDWFGWPLRDYILYELHVGTFTEEGTFDAVIPHLARLRELGVTALELMPVAQFPGKRNWGYDGAYPFAVQNSYGGPEALKRLVNACHQHGLAAVLDVVYNHLGPEGNYLGEFAPYFTERYQTPWGRALNFDGPDSDEVRRYFLENALHWQTEYHFDALRLDAVHAICDFSAVPFLEELGLAAHRQAETLNRRFYLIAESDQNDAKLVAPRALGGYGLDAQWSDDFHHSLHVLLTGEQTGYYADYDGLRALAKTWREGWAYTGQYSRYRRRRHGNSPRQTDARQLVACAQNHDQVGNRMRGERLAELVSFEALKTAAGALLLSPFVPLLFMGEEYGETAPFQYFTSHSDPDLVEAVRQGRRREFASFKFQGEAPDPHAVLTFEQSRLDLSRAGPGRSGVLREYYRELIGLRKRLPALAGAEKETARVREYAAEKTLWVQYESGREAVVVLLCFSREPVVLEIPLSRGSWHTILDSGQARWDGPGDAVSARLEQEDGLRLNVRGHTVLVFERAKLTE